MRRPDTEKLQAQCDTFNAAHPVGSKVSVHLDSGEVRETTTRSEAQILSGHTPVIWLDGVSGCYLLDRVFPIGQAPTKALSVRQPWAWLIVNGHKDIENRTWPTKFRGPVLIHASKGMTRREYEDVCQFLARDHHLWRLNAKLPLPAELARGGIVGQAEIVDSVTASASPWYMGAHGFVLRNAKPLRFQPLKGALGFFEVPAQGGWK